jgi:hypothetical protein
LEHFRDIVDLAIDDEKGSKILAAVPEVILEDIAHF